MNPLFLLIGALLVGFPRVLGVLFAIWLARLFWHFVWK